MLKVILTAAIILSVGILPLVKTSTPDVNTPKTETVSVTKVLAGSRVALATAD